MSAEPQPAPAPPPRRRADPWYVRCLLVGLTLGIVGVLIVVPLASVFAQATAKGLGVYWSNLVANPDTRHAVFLTLVVAPVAVALNVVGGIAAAWAIARFRFPGRGLLAICQALSAPFCKHDSMCVSPPANVDEHAT